MTQDYPNFAYTNVMHQRVQKRCVRDEDSLERPRGRF